MILNGIFDSRREESCAELARVSMGGTEPALVGDCEHRGVTLIAASGVLRIPKAGEEQLVLKTKDGVFAALGVCADDVPDGLSEGDILIKNGAASITLHSDGRVELCGKLIINGSEPYGTQT